MQVKNLSSGEAKRVPGISVNTACVFSFYHRNLEKINQVICVKTL